MEEALVALLLADPGVAALLGARLTWGLAPQGQAAPFGVMTVISGVRDTTYAGPAGDVSSRVQIDAYGTTYASAKTVARAVETKLSGFRGTAGTRVFMGAFLENERDGFEDRESASDLFRVSLDFIIWHKGA